jgi:hypothetical protein
MKSSDWVPHTKAVSNNHLVPERLLHLLHVVLLGPDDGPGAADADPPDRLRRREPVVLHDIAADNRHISDSRTNSIPLSYVVNTIIIIIISSSSSSSSSLIAVNR